MQLTWFDIIISVIVILSLLKGYMSGLVMQIASLAGLLCCAFFAGKIAALISPYLISITDVSDYLIKPLSYLFAFILIMIVFLLIGKFIEGFMKVIRINTLNKLIGSVFSVAKWLILTSILLNILVGLDPNQRIIKSEIKEKSHSYHYIKNIAPYFIPFLSFDSQQEE